jgi:hypothetical protein
MNLLPSTVVIGVSASSFFAGASGAAGSAAGSGATVGVVLALGSGAADEHAPARTARYMIVKEPNLFIRYVLLFLFTFFFLLSTFNTSPIRRFVIRPSSDFWGIVTENRQ